MISGAKSSDKVSGKITSGQAIIRLRFELEIVKLENAVADHQDIG